MLYIKGFYGVFNDQLDLRTDKTGSNLAAFSLGKQRGQSRTLTELLKKTVEMRSTEAKGTRCCFDFKDSQAGFCRQLLNHLTSLQGRFTPCCNDSARVGTMVRIAGSCVPFDDPLQLEDDSSDSLEAGSGREGNTYPPDVGCGPTHVLPRSPARGATQNSQRWHTAVQYSLLAQCPQSACRSHQHTRARQIRSTRSFHDLLPR